MRTLFYWAPLGMEPQVAYEAAALQALMGLQAIYSFVIHDYSFHGLVPSTALARRLLPLASGAVRRSHSSESHTRIRTLTAAAGRRCRPCRQISHDFP